MPSFTKLRWDNQYAALGESFSQRIDPTPIPDPSLVAWNPNAAELLDLDGDPRSDPELLAVLAGNRVVPGMDPIATLYAGYQFGVWVPQLGDGRAILLGEVVNQRHQRWDVQLKGAGLTRYSRMGDGRAVLRSTIREYLGSEAMHGLGIATTRALAIVSSPLPVYRERTETAAVLTRLAPTHVRFGTFEVLASRGLDAERRRLADMILQLHFPELLTLPEHERYNAWYAEIVARTARLMAAWIAAGYAHGVMNTDNFSILGITLDYGPYGWLDDYDPGLICNHTDHTGRYAFGQQPMVGLWNCARLGEALHPLVTEDAAVAALEAYRTYYESAVTARMRARLGLATAEPDDLSLIAEWLDLLHRTGADYSRSFRALSRWSVSTDNSTAPLRIEVDDANALDAWLPRYAARLAREQSNEAARHAAMLRTNPKYLLRNWVAQDAITNAESGNFVLVDQLRELLRSPFDEHPAMERFAEGPPEWARDLSVSCSS